MDVKPLEPRNSRFFWGLRDLVPSGTGWGINKQVASSLEEAITETKKRFIAQVTDQMYGGGGLGRVTSRSPSETLVDMYNRGMITAEQLLKATEPAKFTLDEGLVQSARAQSVRAAGGIYKEEDPVYDFEVTLEGVDGTTNVGVIGAGPGQVSFFRAADEQARLDVKNLQQQGSSFQPTTMEQAALRIQQAENLRLMKRREDQLEIAFKTVTLPKIKFNRDMSLFGPVGLFGPSSPGPFDPIETSGPGIKADAGQVDLERDPDTDKPVESGYAASLRQQLFDQLRASDE